MNKQLKDLYEYSNPAEVAEKAHELGLGDVHHSTRKDKKYMIHDPFKGRMVHFGQFFYEDYMKHKDERRRQNFLKRNARWKRLQI